MDITHDLNIKASPATVYQAVSTQQGIKGWWSKECTVGETPGQDSVLQFNKQGTIVEMGFRTLELEPNKKVVWECTDNGNSTWPGTKIITTISESPDGSSVTFSHAGFDEKWAGEPAFEMTKGGWDHFVSSLVSFCEGGEGQPW